MRVHSENTIRNQGKFRGLLRSRRAQLAASVAAAASFAGIARTSQAGSLYFDLSSNSGLNAGSGSWDLTANDWATTATPGAGVAPGPYSNGSDVYFETAATNTLTLNNTSLVVNSITQATSGTVTTINSSGSNNQFTLTTGSITNTGNLLTINPGIILGASATITQTGSITINGAISDGGHGYGLATAGANTLTLAGSNTYTGATNANVGTLVIANGGFINSASAVSVNSSAATGALVVNSGGTIGGNVSVGISSAVPNSLFNNADFTNNGTVLGTVTTSAGASTPAVNGNTVLAGFATLGSGSSTGPVVDNGYLAISGSTAPTLGTISTSAATIASATGEIFLLNSGNSNLNFASGTSLIRVEPINGSVTTLNTSGTVNIFDYASSDNTNPFTVTFNSGTWNLGQTGQNSSSQQTAGTTNILGGSTVNIGTLTSTVDGASSGGGYMHGIYNVGGASSGTLAITGNVSEGNGRGTAPTGAAINGLQFTVGNGGSLSISGAASLGFTVAQTVVAQTNSLTVNTGGNAAILGLTEGSNVANTFAETNSTTVAGGSLAISGAVALGNTGTSGQLQSNSLNVNSGTASVTGNILIGTANNAAANNVSNLLSVAGGSLIDSGSISVGAGTNQSNTFSFTGGTLTVGAYKAGGLTATDGISAPTAGTLFVGSSGGTSTLAPGYINAGGTQFTGRTTVTGNLQFDTGSVLAINLGGTTAATGFGSLSSDFDNISVSGVGTLGGKLQIALLNSFNPTGDTFNIGTFASSSGTFSNVSTDGRVSVTGGGSFFVNDTGTTLTLSQYGTGSDLVWAGTGSAWDVSTTADFLKNGVASTYTDGSFVDFDNTGIAQPSITLNATVSPAGVTFANTSGTYTLSGSGGIAGSSPLSVIGNGGTTVLGTANTNTGTITVGAGATLQVGNSAGTSGSIGTGTILDNGALIFNRTSTLTQGTDFSSAAITGTGSLTQSGLGGTLILTAADTFSGGTTIATGSTLQLGNAGATGSLAPAGSITDNGTLAFNLTGTATQGTTFSTAGISGTGGLAQISGTVILNVSEGYSGATLVNGGTLSITAAGNIAGSSGTTVSSSASLVNAGTIGALTINSGGTGTLSGGSTAGAITLNGTLDLTGSTAITTGTITGSGNSGSIVNSNTLAGGNTLTFSGTNSFKNITASAGTLNLAGGSSTNTLGGPAYTGVVNSTGTGAVVIQSGTFLESQTSATYVAGSSSVGTLIISGGTLSIGIARNLYGNITINGGNLITETLANDAGNDSQFTFGAGTPANGTSNITVSSGLFQGDSDQFNGYRLYPGTAGTSGTTTTSFTQTGGVVSIGVVTGGSTLADRDLNIGITTATNNTTVSYSLGGGKLLVAGTLSAAANAGTNQNEGFTWTGGQLSAGTINTANFNLTGSSILGGTITSGGTLAPGDIGTTGKTTITGNYAGNGSSTLAFDIAATSSGTNNQSSSFQDSGAGHFDLLAVSGTVTLNDALNVTVIDGANPVGSTYQIITAAGGVSGLFTNLAGSIGTTTDGAYTYTVTEDSNDVTLSNFNSVPEPGSIGALVVCSMGLMARRRRRA